MYIIIIIIVHHHHVLIIYSYCAIICSQPRIVLCCWRGLGLYKDNGATDHHFVSLYSYAWVRILFLNILPLARTAAGREGGSKQQANCTKPFRRLVCRKSALIL